MKINVLVSIFSAMLFALLLTGCDNPPAGWYKINGGFINLHQVSRIESNGSAELNGKNIFDGSLSRENLEQLRDEIKKADKAAKITIIGNITFDKNYIVELPSGNNISPKEAIKIIDEWAIAMQQLAQQLPE